MKAIELLQACRNVKAQIDDYDMRIERLRAMVTRITRPLDHDGGRGTSDSDIMAEYVSQLDKIDAEKKARMKNAHAEIMAATLMLDECLKDKPRNRQVLFLYYLDMYTVASVSIQMHLSQAHIKTLKAEGLNVLKDVEANKWLPKWYTKKAGNK